MDDDAAASRDLFDMYEYDIFAGFEAQHAADLLGPCDYDHTVQQQQDLDPGDIDRSETELLHDLAFVDKSERHFDHAVAAAGTFDMPSPRYQKRDTVAAANAVQVSVVDLCDTDDDDIAAVDNTVVGLPPDNPGIFPHDINALNAGDCPQLEADERIFELTSAEFQRLIAASAAAGAMKTPSARGQKRRRDTADDDIDAGGARGASPAQQLDPAVKDDGSRQDQHAPADREPNAATSLVSCGGKRDAATQVSEALLLQEFGSVTPTRDVSTQVSEDDLRNDDDSFEATTPELLPDAANGIYEDELQPLPFHGSADFTEYATIPFQFEDYTAPMDQDFVGFFDFKGNATDPQISPSTAQRPCTCKGYGLA